MSDYIPNPEEYFDFERYMADDQDPFHPIPFHPINDMDLIGHGAFNFDENMAVDQNWDYSTAEGMPLSGPGTQPDDSDTAAPIGHGDVDFPVDLANAPNFDFSIAEHLLPIGPGNQFGLLHSATDPIGHGDFNFNFDDDMAGTQGFGFNNAEASPPIGHGPQLDLPDANSATLEP